MGSAFLFPFWVLFFPVWLVRSLTGFRVERLTKQSLFVLAIFECRRSRKAHFFTFNFNKLNRIEQKRKFIRFSMTEKRQLSSAFRIDFAMFDSRCFVSSINQSSKRTSRCAGVDSKTSFARETQTQLGSNCGKHQLKAPSAKALQFWVSRQTQAASFVTFDWSANCGSHFESREARDNSSVARTKCRETQSARFALRRALRKSRELKLANKSSNKRRKIIVLKTQFSFVSCLQFLQFRSQKVKQKQTNKQTNFEKRQRKKRWNLKVAKLKTCSRLNSFREICVCVQFLTFQLCLFRWAIVAQQQTLLDTQNAAQFELEQSWKSRQQKATFALICDWLLRALLVAV